MCSGCFGEYEEFDDEFEAERDGEAMSVFETVRSNSGSVRNADEAGRGYQGVAHDEWSRFDVFVGTDYIVEVRLVRDATLNRLKEEPPGGGKFKRSADASAKYYRTPEPGAEQVRSALLAPSKWFIGIGLVFAVCGAVVVWLALS